MTCLAKGINVFIALFSFSNIEFIVVNSKVLMWPCNAMRWKVNTDLKISIKTGDEMETGKHTV